MIGESYTLFSGAGGSSSIGLLDIGYWLEVYARAHLVPGVGLEPTLPLPGKGF